MSATTVQVSSAVRQATSLQSHVTSACRWSSGVVASQISLGTRCFERHSAASLSESSSAASQRTCGHVGLHEWKTRGSHHLSQSPPLAVTRMWDGAQVEQGSIIGAGQVGRKRSHPTPPILRSTLAQATLIGKRKDTHT